LGIGKFKGGYMRRTALRASIALLSVGDAGFLVRATRAINSRLKKRI